MPTSQAVHQQRKAPFLLGPSSLQKIYQVLEPWVKLTRVGYFAGSMVVFWPYAWALTMSARKIAMPVERFSFLMVLGFIAAFLSHSWFDLCAGCIWNDIFDRDFDAQVDRTKNRPLASGQVSITGAFVFLCVHMVILLSMMWEVNPLAWKVGLLALFPLTGVYPFMKRITYWPQAWLGLAINIGISMAWATTTETIPISSIVLSVGCFFWTLWYDTIYACQDKKDDVNAGVKSTAVLFGSHVKRIIALFGTLFISGLTISGFLNQQSLSFYLVAVIGGSMHLTWQLLTVDSSSPKDCWRKFESNGYSFGVVVEIGLLLDYITSAGIRLY